MADSLPDYSILQTEAMDENTSRDRLFELAKISTELAQLVAQNPTAPPELLEELGNSTDSTTRQNVAANPNTPADVLLSLGGEFPEQLLGNPVFSLLLLENPYQIQQLPHTMVLSLLKCETVPDCVLELAASHSNWEVRFAVATNTRTPQTVLAKLIQQNTEASDYNEILEAARLHVNLAGEITSGWHEAAFKTIRTTNLELPGKYLDSDLIKCVEHLENKDCFLKFVIEQLAQHQNETIRQLIARNPNTPAQILEQLAGDEDREVRLNVRRNPNTPVQLLQQLALDGDRDLRRDVASNPNVPVELLQQLTRDGDDFIRQCIASHRNTPIFLLEWLARDGDNFVRQRIASNPNTPVQLLKQLALDQCDFVRWSVASNPNLPIWLLEQLVQDSNRSTRGYVASNPNTPIWLLEQLARDDLDVRMSVAGNPKTPCRLLERLAQDESSLVRMSVASNPSTPVQLLERWAQDKAGSFRGCVAKNSNTPIQLLEQLAQDKSSEVRSFVLHNPKTPVNLFVELILKFYPQQSTPSLIRFLALLHPQASAKVLGENVCAIAWIERYAVAQNPNTSLDTLQALVVDANCIVRAVANANLESRYPYGKVLSPEF